MENDSFAQVNASKSAPAVLKAARILKELGRESGPLGISELARRLDMNKSSVHAAVSALAREGFLTPDIARRYSLGPELMNLGARGQEHAVKESAEKAFTLGDLEPGETMFFGRLEGDGVIIMLRRGSPGALHLSAPIGSAVPLNAGALGKAMRLGVLEQALERSEYIPGVAAAAVAFRWLSGTYFVWIVGIDSNYDDAALEDAGKRARDVAREICRGTAKAEEMTA